MRKTLFALAIGLATVPMLASAQQSPVGKWKTLDDETGKAMTVVEVYQAKNGTLAAKIVEIADKCPVHRTLMGEIIINTTPGDL